MTYDRTISKNREKQNKQHKVVLTYSDGAIPTLYVCVGVNYLEYIRNKQIFIIHSFLKNKRNEIGVFCYVYKNFPLHGLRFPRNLDNVEL